MLSDADLNALARVAADSIALALRWGAAEPLPVARSEAALTELGASFVTLRQGTTVRGCIGSLAAFRPLDQDVAENARAAALRDRRFEPLNLAELAGAYVDVAVLTESVVLVFDDEQDLHRQLRPGRDGLTVEHEDASATYLPEVWEQFTTPDQFIAELRRKAGIDDAVPLSELRFERFAACYSAPVSVDREVPRRRDLRAGWWRWRWRVRERIRRVARRRATHAGQR